MLKIAVVAVCTLASTPAFAAFMDGNALYPECRRQRPQSLGYVMGVYDTLDGRYIVPTIDGAHANVKKTICLPANATVGQLHDVSCAYIEQNPQIRHYPAFSLIQAALVQAFPCN